QSIAVAVRLAQASGGTVLLLQIVNPTTDFGAYPAIDQRGIERVIDAACEQARNYLSSVASSSSFTDVHTETEVRVGQPAETILSRAERGDLLVICSHRRTGFKRWTLGSIAERIAQQAPIPVLIVYEGGSTLAEETEEPLRILIPLDGSELAKAAIAPAIQLIR